MLCVVVAALVDALVDAVVVGDAVVVVFAVAVPPHTTGLRELRPQAARAFSEHGQPSVRKRDGRRRAHLVRIFERPRSGGMEGELT